MKIEYSHHALYKMGRRGISENDIKEAIIKGQQRWLQVHSTIKCIYTKNGKELVVIYEQNRENYKVITTYYKDENENNLR